MLSEDIGHAIGLLGGIADRCAFCDKTHFIVVHPKAVTICSCGAIHTIREMDSEVTMGIWTAAAKVRATSEALWNDLPTLQ